MMMMPFNVKLATLHTGKVEEKENKDYLNDLHAESKGTKKILSFSSVVLSLVALPCIITAIVKFWFCHIPQIKKEIQLKKFSFCEKAISGLVVNKA